MKKLTTLAMGALLVSPLTAQTRLHVDDNATPGGDGTTWSKAFRDLQSALLAADASAGADEIWVAAGTYHADPNRTDRTKSFQLRTGVAIYGGFAGTESDLAGRNPDPATNATVLSGDLVGNDGADFANYGDNTRQVVKGTGTDATAVLDGFTIRGGHADGPAPANTGAGLICNGSGSPTITRCRFVANKATSSSSNTSGGAVSLTTLNPGITAPVFRHCDFVGNRVSALFFVNGYGGAVNINESRPTFLDCRFEFNAATAENLDAAGGAVSNYYSASSFIRCSFRGNQAKSNGGAISFINIDPDGPPRVVNCEFAGNRANFGGAVHAFATAAPVFTNGSFTGNRANNLGGAIYAGSSSSLRFANCILWNNRAGSTTTDPSATVSLNAATASFLHCIVANSGGSAAWQSPAGTDLGGNLDADPRLLAPVDPALAPSIAGDLRLGEGSAATNQGSNSADLDGGASGTETIADLAEDLIGGARIQDDIIDIGAIEGTFAATPDTFAALYPGLDPADDDNGNGRSNFLDYASGGDPTAPDDPATRPAYTDGLFTASHRIDVSDVTPSYEKSTNLTGWEPMIEGLDYSVLETTPEGVREQVTMQILPGLTSAPAMFFRQKFPVP